MAARPKDQDDRPVQGGTSAAQRPAPSFGRHDFEDLWRETVVGELDPTSIEVLRADDVEPDTDPELTLFHLLSAAIAVDDRGVWIANGDPVPGVEQWSPRKHLQDAGHWRDGPALPFPFTPGELAAFMRAGPGWWVGEAFGGLDKSAPDLSRLPLGRDVQEEDAERTRRLLVLVWDAYHAAVQSVGPRRSARARASSSRKASARSAKAELAWLGAMCVRLLIQLGEVAAPKTVPTPALTEIEGADARRVRRLARLRELDGDMRRSVEGAWQMTGVRGALAALVREEAAAKRPMSDKSDVRADLAAAMEAELGDQRGS